MAPKSPSFLPAIQNEKIKLIEGNHEESFFYCENESGYNRCHDAVTNLSKQPSGKMLFIFFFSEEGKNKSRSLHIRVHGLVNEKNEAIEKKFRFDDTSREGKAYFDFVDRHEGEPWSGNPRAISEREAFKKVMEAFLRSSIFDIRKPATTEESSLQNSPLSPSAR